MSWYRNLIGKAGAVAKNLAKEVVQEEEHVIKYGSSEIGKLCAEFEQAVARIVHKADPSLHVHVASNGHFDPQGAGQLELKVQTIASVLDEEPEPKIADEIKPPAIDPLDNAGQPITPEGA